MFNIFVLLVASYVQGGAGVIKSNEVQIMTRLGQLSEQPTMPGLSNRRKTLQSFISNSPVWNNSSEDTKTSQDLYYYKKVKNSPSEPPVFQKRPKFKANAAASSRKKLTLDLSSLAYSSRAKSTVDANPQYVFNNNHESMKMDNVEGGDFFRQTKPQRLRSGSDTNAHYVFNSDQDSMKTDETDAGNFYRQKRSDESAEKAADTSGRYMFNGEQENMKSYEVDAGNSFKKHKSERPKSDNDPHAHYMFSSDQESMKTDEAEASSFYRHKRSKNSNIGFPLPVRRTRFEQDVPLTPRRKTLVDVAFSAFTGNENRDGAPKSYIFNDDWTEAGNPNNQFRKLKALDDSGARGAGRKNYVFSEEIDSENWGKDAESAKNYRIKRSMELNRMVRPRSQQVKGENWVRDEEGVNNFYKQLTFRNNQKSGGPKNYVFNGELESDSSGNEEDSGTAYYKRLKSLNTSGGPKNYVFSAGPDTDNADKRGGGDFRRRKRDTKIISKPIKENLSGVKEKKPSRPDTVMDVSNTPHDTLKTAEASNNHYIFTDPDSIKADWEMDDDSFYRHKRSKTHREHRNRQKVAAGDPARAASIAKTATGNFKEKDDKLDPKAKFDLEASLSELMKLYNVKGSRQADKEDPEMGSLFVKPTAQPEARGLKDVPKDLYHSALVPGVVLRVLMTEAVLKMQYRNYNGDMDESVVEADVEFLRLARKVLIDELSSFSELKRMVGLFANRNSLVNQHTCEGTYYVLGVPWTNFSTPEENLKRWCLFDSVFLDRVPYVVGADGSLMAAVAPPILQCDSSRCATVPFVDAIMFEERLHASHVHIITRCQSECRRQCKNAVGCLERCNTDCEDVRNA